MRKGGRDRFLEGSARPSADEGREGGRGKDKGDGRRLE